MNIRNKLKITLKSKKIFFPILLIGNWLSQSIFSMDKTEKIARLSIEIILIVILFIIFLFLTPLHILLSLVIAFLIANTLSWFMFSNAHLYIIASLEIATIEKKSLKIYIEGLKKRGNRNQAILCIAIFGSMSRGEFHEYSDLDARVIRKKGFKNGILAVGFIIKERWKAQKNRIPLEILLGDSTSFMKKMRKDEPPVIIYDPNNEIISNFKKSLTLKEALKLNKIME